jgi:DNA-binding LacI/PurR family transcriptional regulator
MAIEPKYEQIQRELLAEIVAGRFGPSNRMPSEAQLVRRFKASRPTVGRALRGLQDQGLIDRRVGSGTYVRKAAGPTAISARQFGLMIPGLGTTEIFEIIAGELAGLARGQDYGLLWGSGARPQADAAPSVAEVEEWCEQFIQREVAGVFFAPFEHLPNQDRTNHHLAEKLRQAGIAVVLLDRDLGQFPSRSEFDLVGIDNFAAGYLIAEHLLKLGAKRLGFVTRPHAAPTVSARIAGAREAILDRGLAVSTDFVRAGDLEDVTFIEALTNNPPEGLIAANDQTAAVVMRLLQRKGLNVPKGVRVVGFDDLRLATLVSVPLTTVHQPCREIAITALRAMLERLADPTLPARSLTLTPRLVVRESCGAYR